MISKQVPGTVMIVSVLTLVNKSYLNRAILAKIMDLKSTTILFLDKCK